MIRNRHIVFVALMAAFMLTGCTKVAVEKAVLNSLTDPDSAKIKDIRYSEDKAVACVWVNSKNRMGGYTGFRWVPLYRASDGWTTITPFEDDLPVCGNGWLGLEALSRRLYQESVQTTASKLETVTHWPQAKVLHATMLGECMRLHDMRWRANLSLALDASWTVNPEFSAPDAKAILGYADEYLADGRCEEAGHFDFCVGIRQGTVEECAKYAAKRVAD